MTIVVTDCFPESTHLAAIFSMSFVWIWCFCQINIFGWRVFHLVIFGPNFLGRLSLFVFVSFVMFCCDVLHLDFCFCLFLFFNKCIARSFSSKNVGVIRLDVFLVISSLGTLATLQVFRCVFHVLFPLGGPTWAGWFSFNSVRSGALRDIVAGAPAAAGLLFFCFLSPSLLFLLGLAPFPVPLPLRAPPPLKHYMKAVLVTTSG